MDKETWVSLQQPDRIAWDKITDDGKTKILNYAKSKPKTTPDSAYNNNIPTRTINEHDIIFDEPNDKIEVKTHELSEDSMTTKTIQPPDKTPDADLLGLDTNQTDSSANKGITISTMMHGKPRASTQTKLKIGTHEFFSKRSDYTPFGKLEINMHRIDFNDFVYPDSDDEDPYKDLPTLLGPKQDQDDIEEDEDDDSDEEEDMPELISRAFIDYQDDDEEEEEDDESEDQAEEGQNTPSSHTMRELENLDFAKLYLAAEAVYEYEDDIVAFSEKPLSLADFQYDHGEGQAVPKDLTPSTSCKTEPNDDSATDLQELTDEQLLSMPTSSMSLNEVKRYNALVKKEAHKPFTGFTQGSNTPPSSPEHDTSPFSFKTFTNVVSNVGTAFYGHHATTQSDGILNVQSDASLLADTGNVYVDSGTILPQAATTPPRTNTTIKQEPLPDQATSIVYSANREEFLAAANSSAVLPDRASSLHQDTTNSLSDDSAIDHSLRENVRATQNALDDTLQELATLTLDDIDTLNATGTDMSSIGNHSDHDSKDMSTEPSAHSSDSTFDPANSVGTLPGDHNLQSAYKQVLSRKQKRALKKKEKKHPKKKNICSMLSPTAYSVQASESSDSAGTNNSAGSTGSATVAENASGPNLSPSHFGEAGQH